MLSNLLIVINHIQNKILCLHNTAYVCVMCVFIYSWFILYININMYYIYFLNIYMYIYIYIYIYI